jgi:hypothetical protein
MSTLHRSDRAAVAPCSVHPARLATVGLALLLAALFVTAPLAGQRAARGADLRCLTSNPDHCLPEAMSPEEPHGAVCSTCHNLWEQTRLQDAAKSCTTSDCHARPETLTPFHRGVDRSVLEQCSTCHDSHDVRIAGGGTNCVTCHTVGGERQRPAKPSGRQVALAVAPGVVYRHPVHQRVECGNCHSSMETHGAVGVKRLQDCRSCHHTERVATGCVSCHSGEDRRGGVRLVSRTLNIQLGSLNQPRRELPFDHADHEQVGCETCHTGGTARLAAGANCSGCHDDHHRPSATCSTCHAAPVDGAHDHTSHLGCAGSGCHESPVATITELTRARGACVICHQGRADHEPGSNCADCHVMPRPRSPVGTLTSR